MNHETCHELLCLRLYGELEASEERAVAEHLASCADCRSFSVELEGSLGTIARAAAPIESAPTSASGEAWRAELLARVRSSTSRRRWMPWATFAAGLAAGLLLALALRASSSPPTSRSEHAPTAALARLDGAPPFVPSAEPPPPATGRGPLARLGALGRR